MKEEKAKSKKSFIYYVILAVCALLIIAATVLTVYFVTQGSGEVAEVPPAGDDVDPPSGGGPSGGEDDKPSGGEDTVRFVVPVDCTEYTMEYGEIYENKTLGWYYRHKAIDFDVDAGSEVRSMADGTVKKVSLSEETGNLVVIDHGDGLLTCYRFVEPDPSLKEGNSVKKGDKIGVVAEAYGSEEFDGAHLHLEVFLNDKAEDPTQYLELVLAEK